MPDPMLGMSRMPRHGGVGYIHNQFEGFGNMNAGNSDEEDQPRANPMPVNVAQREIDDAELQRAIAESMVDPSKLPEVGAKPDQTQVPVNVPAPQMQPNVVDLGA